MASGFAWWSVGLRLLKRVERAVGYMWAPAKTGRYSVLSRLEAAALAQSTTAKDRGPTRTLYSITAAGRAELRAWLMDPALELTPPREACLLKLFFARRAAPAAAVELVVVYRAHLVRLLDERELQERAEPDADRVDSAAVRARSGLGDIRLV